MKVLFWTLIELTTLFVFSGGIFIWLKYRLPKKPQQNNASTDNPETEPENTPALMQADVGSDYEDPSQTLKRLLHKQLQQAAKQFSRAKDQNKSNKLLTLKLWGTLLKAENKVLDTPDKKETEAILKQDLSSILQNIFDSKKDSAGLKELEQKLETLIKTANKSNEVLRLKTELEKAQNVIKKELLIQVSNLEDALGRFSIKRHELAHLELTLANAVTNFEQLKKTLAHLEQEHEFEQVISQKASASSTQEMNKDLTKHTANKKIKSLNQIASRQQVVIDLLREKLQEANQEELINIDESQEVAIKRIEQMIRESDSLILQLENELSSTSLSINTLKSDINIKSQQLINAENQLSSAKKTASGSFRESAKNQQSQVDDMRQQFNLVPKNNQLQSLIQEQQKESDTLERLLNESETCVTLLENELDSAKSANKELIHTIETVDPNFREEAESSSNNKFQQLESQHQILMAEHSQAKQQLLASIADDKETTLRNEFNRKNLEIDRLQLAIVDLEKKQRDSLLAQQEKKE